ncbi:fungal pheromone STE3G-protein-coupled receptor [Rickenella mellea]|uniref:Fungal pheromone STE3G-protein-coupled receptor n=1 Tax=Rickenella mellea TaxID=50990 RepID=A0A4Y7QI78_9AGAM|nr:fungal pheromone STE3G-protein-coupled receptor [Rickenella mellea]
MTAADPTYPLFSVFAFLGFVLALIPLRWHLQAWNAGTCLYMIWSSIFCLNQFINSIVWRDNAINWAPVWCDISSRLIVLGPVAIPAASLCINRRLYKISTTQSVGISREQKQRAILEDLVIGLGLPLISLVMAYCVTGHRFDIFEEIGCYPAVVNVWLTYVLVSTWPLGLGLVSAVYCVLTLRSFYKRNAQFSQAISSNSSGLTLNRYFRLMALATTELLCTTPVAAWATYQNLTAEPLVPYKGWADVHFNFSRVVQVPSALWRSDHGAVVSFELTRWLLVVCAFTFFAFFGFADEARRQYRAAFWAVAKVFGRTPRSVSHSEKSRWVNSPILNVALLM